MEAVLVLRGGSVVYERYKQLRPFDKHVWFSCSKIIVATMVALLEDQGKIDVAQPVTHYLPELAGSIWDTVTLDQTLDMATGLDSTEHEGLTPEPTRCGVGISGPQVSAFLRIPGISTSRRSMS